MVDREQDETSPASIRSGSECSTAGQRSIRFSNPVLLTAWLFGFLVALSQEAARIRSRLILDATPGDWVQAPALDGTYFVPLLFLAPFCWSFRRTPATSETLDVRGFPSHERRRKRPRIHSAFAIAGIALVSVTAYLLSASLPVENEEGTRWIGDTLPLVQDELSYQVQAQGFLQGRWGWPSPLVARELFHQTHVLNEGTFASRYFPGTGLWLMPWNALNHPVWGARFAAMIVAVGIFLIGSELHSFESGVLSGLLTAVSPAMEIFGNLTLSHLPGLVGIVFFLFFFLKFMKHPAPGLAFLSSSGLTAAMLCRPLTAAAIGLPFGIWYLMQWLPLPCGRGADELSRSPRATQIRSLLCLMTPLLFGFLLIGWQNHELTGDWFRTPYQFYTQTYTPRHAFGFHQVSETQEPVFPQRLAAYDDWARDLDFKLAMKNFVRRFRGSLEWWLGLIPLLMSTLLAALTIRWQKRSVQLLFASAVTLQVVHLPYWLDGMLQHHYVFESGPIWILMFSIVSLQLLQQARTERRCFFAAWWVALLALSLLVNHFGIGESGRSRLQSGWQTFLTPTRSWRVFEQALLKENLPRPALIIVRASENDLHCQFVRNRPPFDAEVLIGMERPDLYSLTEIAQLFPYRSVFLYEIKTGRFQPVSVPSRQEERP